MGRRWAEWLKDGGILDDWVGVPSVAEEEEGSAPAAKVSSRGSSREPDLSLAGVPDIIRGPVSCEI